MGRPKHTKKDKNHLEIVRQCREIGMVVWDTADLGGEILDTVIFWRGKVIPVEIKSKGKEGDFTPDEKVGIDKLVAVGVRPIVATCIEDILQVF